MVRCSIDRSTPINLFFSLLDAMVADRACHKFSQLLAQFLKQVNECTLWAHMESLHGLITPSGEPAFPL